MPTYEYHCSKCNHAFETVQPMSAKPLETCPKELCPQKRWGKGKVKRGVGGGAGLIFKGSGFYITDYRSEGYKSAAKQDSSTTPPATSSTPSTTPTASSSDSKPAAKPAAKSDSKPSK